MKQCLTLHFNCLKYLQIGQDKAHLKESDHSQGNKSDPLYYIVAVTKIKVVLHDNILVYLVSLDKCVSSHFLV